MGYVTVPGSANISCEDIEGEISLEDLFEDIRNPQYTHTYRISCIKAAGKIGRAAWGVLHDLHHIAKDITKDADKILAEAARDAIKKIDPGMPLLTNALIGNTSKINKTSTRHGAVQTIPTPKKIELSKVIVTDLETDDLTNGARVYGTCCFCEKTAILTDNMQKFNKSISPPETIYCTTCLRNGMYRSRMNRNTLILTYRSIIGYYYHCFHLTPATRNEIHKVGYMQINDIQGYIDLHVKLGQNNPLFHYDPECYTWFVDFSRIGNGKRRVPVEHVLETVIQQIAAFNLYENVKDSSPQTFYQRYKEAIVDFLHHRKRPAGQKILSPTLYGCGIPYDNNAAKAISSEVLKKFVPGHLIDNYKIKNRQHYH